MGEAQRNSYKIKFVKLIKSEVDLQIQYRRKGKIKLKSRLRGIELDIGGGYHLKRGVENMSLQHAQV